MPIVMQDVLVSSYQTGGSDGAGIPVSAAWSSPSDSTASFDGRLLAARDLTGEQTQSRGETTIGDVVIVKTLDKSHDAMDPSPVETADALGGGAQAGLGDVSVRFLADDVW